MNNAHKNNGASSSFELNGSTYVTDAETAALLRAIVPEAKSTGDSSAVQAVLFLGLETGRIRERR